MRKNAPVCALCVALTMISGCSVAFDPNADPGRDPYVRVVDLQSSSVARSGKPYSVQPQPIGEKGVITVIVVGNGQLPANATDAFTIASGYSLKQIHVDAGQPDTLKNAVADTHADIVIGLDWGGVLRATSEGVLRSDQAQTAAEQKSIHSSEAPSENAFVYSRDDICVMADKQWFSANGKPLPQSMEDISTKDMASRLIIPDPSDSSAGEFFLALTAALRGNDASMFWSNLLKQGTLVLPMKDAEQQWSAVGVQGRPLLVTSFSAILRRKEKTHSIEDVAVPVNGTCVRRNIFGAQTAQGHNGEAIRALKDFLTSAAGTKYLEESYRDRGARGDEPLAAADARTISAREHALAGTYLNEWEKVRSAK